MIKDDITIQSFSHEGRGVGFVGEHTVFVSGALPGEIVDALIIKKRKKVMDGLVRAVREPSSERVTPLCQHFMSCGGCALQHLSSYDQLRYKQQWFSEQLLHHMPEADPTWLPAIQGITEGYRRKARLSVKYVEKQGKVLIGFRELRGGWVQDMQQCVVLPAHLIPKIKVLAQVFTTFDARRSIPQIEFFVTDSKTVCLVRHLEPLSEADQVRLLTFAMTSDWQIWLQPKGPKTIHPFWPEAPGPLFYRLPLFDLTIDYQPGDFLQVHAEVNQAMIVQALALLDLTPGMRVLDLFCGLGNFSLPCAQQGAVVSAVEGCSDMVARASLNAEKNGLTLDCFVEDLQAEVFVGAWAKQSYDRLILDPPRSGAWALLPWIADNKIPVIVYISCNQATFVRDAQWLTEHGYVLTHTGTMDMFPHTEHVEVMGRFLYQGEGARLVN